MNRILAKGALAFVGLTLTAASAVAQEINLGLDRVIASPAPASTALPWVNVRAYELDGFEPLKNTVEFQITTNQTTLDGGDPGGCCPVPGRGNLGAGEELRSISLTVNPALLAVPGAALIVQWTGEPVVIYNDVFPDAGQKPSSIVVSSNPAATDFDITISFAEGTNVTHSKLLASYFVNNVVTELNMEDIAFVNATGYTAMAVIQYGSGGNAGFGVIGAVPEPETYAMLGLGMIVLGFAVRRQRRR